MKKIIMCFVLSMMLLLPMTATATYLGSATMDMNANSPSWNHWLTDYEATVDYSFLNLPTSYEEIFCTEDAAGNMNTIYYDFFAVDDSLNSHIVTDGDIIESKLFAATWFANQWKINSTSKTIAQIAIWETMFGDNLPVVPTEVSVLMGLFVSAQDKHDYIGDWLLAVSPSENPESDPNILMKNSIFWFENYQNFLVPNVQPVPEPASLFLIGVGLLGLSTITKRKLSLN